MARDLPFKQSDVSSMLTGPTNIMTKEDLKTLSNIAIIELYEEFIRWDHYDPTDTFDYLRDLKISKFDVREELMRRIGK